MKIYPLPGVLGYGAGPGCGLLGVLSGSPYFFVSEAAAITIMIIVMTKMKQVPTTILTFLLLSFFFILSV
jgi:hypothetical protein